MKYIKINSHCGDQCHLLKNLNFSMFLEQFLLIEQQIQFSSFLNVCLLQMNHLNLHLVNSQVFLSFSCSHLTSFHKQIHLFVHDQDKFLMIACLHFNAKLLLYIQTKCHLVYQLLPYSYRLMISFDHHALCHQL